MSKWRKKREDEKIYDNEKPKLDALRAATQPLAEKFKQLRDSYPGAVHPMEARKEYENLLEGIDKLLHQSDLLWTDLEGEYKDAENAFSEMADEESDEKANEEWGEILAQRSKVMAEFHDIEDGVKRLRDRILKKIGKEEN